MPGVVTATELAEALEGLVSQLPLVIAATNPVFAVAAVHGARYAGPTVEAQLTQATRLLARWRGSRAIS